MRTLPIAAFAALAVLTSVHAGPAAGVTPPALAARAHPMSITGSGSVLGDPTLPGGAPFTAQGHGTMLGKWTNAGTLAIDPVTLEATGDVVFEAANGDLLTATFVGEFDPGSGTAQAVFLWDGGTGRFEGASGTSDFIVQQSPDGPFTFTSNGWLDLP